MPLILVVVLVVVPLVELAIVIQVGQVLGVGPTIALLVVNSIIGALLLRRESRRAWREFRAALQEGRWPGDEVTQGGLVIIGGTLLLTPGFVTDAIGFLLLIPGSRSVLSALVRARFGASLGGPGRGAGVGRGAGESRPPRRDGADRGEPATLDVEVVEVRREDEGPTAAGDLGDDH